uniref:Uncharacterized protein n=1 Tax=Anopheles darlingi TaxID=43151 RepID=A0A2M4DKP1_ANODA
MLVRDSDAVCLCVCVCVCVCAAVCVYGIGCTLCAHREACASWCIVLSLFHALSVWTAHLYTWLVVIRESNQRTHTHTHERAFLERVVKISVTLLPPRRIFSLRIIMCWSSKGDFH